MGHKYNNFFVNDNLELFYVYIINIEYLFKIKFIAYVMTLKFNFDMFLSKFDVLFIIYYYYYLLLLEKL